MLYRFTNYEVDLLNFQLSRNGTLVPLEPQAFDLLTYLIANRGRVVSRQEIIDNIWKGRFVSDNSISNRIKTVRKALRDDGARQQIIKTIHGRGYRFVVDVSELDGIGERFNKKHIMPALDKSIAVLAFTDMSFEHDQEYFSDGISEELINLLTKVPQLNVISRTSSFSYKEKKKSATEIAIELGASHILEGSVRKSGNKVRITAQLIQGSDGTHLWSDTYDHSMTDIFKTQDEIATTVTDQLKLALIEGKIATPPITTDAYTLYLQASYQYNKFTDEATKKAEELVKKSIAIDQTYAPSWLLLSRIIFRSTFYLYQRPFAEGLELAEKAVLEALKLDGRNALSYAQISMINIMNWDFRSSISHMNTALDLGGNESSVISIAANNAMDLGKIDEALNLLRKSIRIDPLLDINYYHLGIIYCWLGRFDEALRAIEKYNRTKPDAAIQHTTVSFLLIRQGRIQEALKESIKEPNPLWKLFTQHGVFFALGDKKMADSLLAQFIEKYGSFHPVTLAYMYAYRKELDNAFKWLEVAYEQRHPNLIMKLNYTYFRNLHNDPRWAVFIKKMDFPEGHWLLERVLSS